MRSDGPPPVDAFSVPEKFRTAGPAGENCGAFVVPYRGLRLRVVAFYGFGWEHVSVSLPDRTPRWEMMAFVKSLFWGPEACVVEYHPPASRYIDVHKHCLHLWRPIGIEMPMPPLEFV